MDTGFDYAQLIAQKYKCALITPLNGAWEFLNRPRELPWQKDWEAINKMSIRYNWAFDLDLNKILKESEFAIVVTDEKQIIKFVSSKFETMTGYKVAEALGRKPNFLQGKETDSAVTKKIRESIAATSSVSETVLNYKKDGTSYLCKVEIHPIFDKRRNLVNFIAIEKQL